MSLLSLLLWSLALAIVIHTLAEAAAPRIMAGGRLVAIFDRAIWIENLPIFIALIIGAILGAQFPILASIIPAVAVTHPFLDHVALSFRHRQLRPGTATALLLMLPLGLVFYGYVYKHSWFGQLDIIVGSSIGLGISLLLLWLTIKFPATSN
jgi:hypothetical protein